MRLARQGQVRSHDTCQSACYTTRVGFEQDALVQSFLPLTMLAHLMHIPKHVVLISVGLGFSTALVLH